MFYVKRLLKIYENSQENTWVGVCFLINCRLEACNVMKKRPWLSCLHVNFYNLREHTLRERLAKTTCTKVCTCIFRNTCATGTHIMFVRISTDTISSLTVHFINQFSKQTRWLWWKNQMCISRKKWFVLVKCVIIPLSWVWKCRPSCIWAKPWKFVENVSNHIKRFMQQ